MRTAVTVKNNRLLFAFLIFSFAVSVLGTVGLAPQVAAQGTAVGATVCAAKSTITLNHPASDSIITSSTVPIDGTVSQASQIEIRIDGAFDSVIPLSIGQTTFSGSVEVHTGTHTIELTALNTCPGPNGTASAVVTYTLPPQTPSEGSGTPTTVGGVTSPVENVDEHDSTGGLGIIGHIAAPLEGLAAWLNIDTGSQVNPVHGLSIGRAITVTAGVYLLVIGVAPTLLQAMSTLPLVVQALPAVPAPSRVRLLGRIGRLAGLLLTIGALFL